MGLTREPPDIKPAQRATGKGWKVLKAFNVGATRGQAGSRSGIKGMESLKGL